MDFIDEYSEVDRNGLHNPKWCAMEEAKDVILNAPTVDAVPVVRCKDCKMWNVEWKHEAGDCYCYKFLEWTDPDFFCAGGERKEKDEVN